MANSYEEDTVLDYIDEDNDSPAKTAGTKDTPSMKKAMHGTYASIHSSGFRDFLLKPALLHAITDCGFEHPSEGVCLVEFCFLEFSVFS